MTEEKPTIEVDISLDNMLIGDLETLEAPKSNKEQLDVLQRILVKPDLRSLPIYMLPTIVKAIREKVMELVKRGN